jgi:hypothetical protein
MRLLLGELRDGCCGCGGLRWWLVLLGGLLSADPREADNCAGHVVAPHTARLARVAGQARIQQLAGAHSRSHALAQPLSYKVRSLLTAEHIQIAWN